MKTPNEIKKGLECCQHDIHSGLCRCDDGCPYRYTDRCDKLRKDALDYIEQLEANQPKWISVEERLPGTSGEYLVIVKSHGGQSVLNYSTAHKLFNAFDIASSAWAKKRAIEVSYWMPLPEPPKEEE